MLSQCIKNIQIFKLQKALGPESLLFHSLELTQLSENFPQENCIWLYLTYKFPDSKLFFLKKNLIAENVWCEDNL